MPGGAVEVSARGLHGVGELRRAAEIPGDERDAEEIHVGLREQNRPRELYPTVFGQLLEKCQAEVIARGGRKKFRFKNKLMSLDGSISAWNVTRKLWP